MPESAAVNPGVGGYRRSSSPMLSLIYWSLLAVVLVTPLPFASVTIWAWGPLATITAIALAGWAMLLMIGRIKLSVSPRKLAVPIILFAVTVAWILIQLAPFTPSSWHHPIWREAAGALKTQLAGRITIDGYRTATALTRLLWYASVFWLALQLCRQADAARRALNAMAFAAFAYAFYGLVIELSGLEMVLWTKKFVYQDSVTSTFINRNSYATYAGIGLICMTAVIARRLMAAGFRGNTLALRLINAINLLLARNWYLLFAWVVIFTALILSNSRAGLVSSMLGLFAFLGALTLSPAISRKLKVGFTAVTTVAIVSFFLVSGDLVTRRFAMTSETAGNRLALYDLTLGAIGDSPILGMGFGTFSQVFQLYRTDIPQFRVPFVKAHNTYLENALELGIPAASALTLSIVLLVIICILGARRRRRDVVFPAAAVGASVLVGLHSLIDFSLQIPGVTIAYVFVLGVGCAQSWSSKKRFG